MSRHPTIGFAQNSRSGESTILFTGSREPLESSKNERRYAMKKVKGQAKDKTKKKVAIKDLPGRPARDEAVRGGAEAVNNRKIK